jgi:hypothetical protein
MTETATAIDGGFRCADCGHGEHLMAWAPANVYGPLGADGELAEDAEVWTDGIHEDSIQCNEHWDGLIEKRVDGAWCRWWNCPKCDGKGRVGGSWHVPADYECSEGLSLPGKYGPYKIHCGWRPVDTLAATA